MIEPPIESVATVTAASRPSTRIGAIGSGLDRSLGLLAGLGFASELIVSMMLPVIPLFARELGASPVVLALMVSISAVASAGGQFIAGIVSDRAGARRLLPAGSVAYGTANLVTSAVSSVAPLVALRGLSGLGSGLYLVGERLYVRQVVDRARLAFGNGLVQAAAAVGVIVGPVLGGALADATDLRFPFVLTGVLSLILAVVALSLPARHRPDSAESLALGTPIQFGRAGLAVLLAANFALSAGYGSFITTFTPYTEEDLGWTITEIGLAFSLFGLGTIVLGPWVAAVADRRGRRLVGALATIPIVVATVALVIPVPDILLFPLLFVAGGGVAGFTASWFALLGIATGGPTGGRAFGTVSALSSIGVVVGALVAGGLWEAVDIQAALMVTVVAMTLAGVVLATYREAPRPVS